MKLFIKALPATRPPFLLLSPICVTLAFALALYNGYSINVFHFVLIIFGAVLSAVAVNTVNEYQDFQSGLDAKTDKTPFSGGSGLLSGKPELANTVKNIALFSSASVILIGLYFCIAVGPSIIFIGMPGMLIIWLYTRWFNKHPWLCYLAPGLGFGLLMIIGSYYLLTNTFSWQLTLLALIPFIQINNLLLLNQYPDIDADKTVGRNHLAIAFGTPLSNHIYLLMSILSMALIIFTQQTYTLPSSMLLSLIPASFSLFSYLGMRRYQHDIAKDIKYLAANALCANLTPVIISLTLFID